MAGVGTAIRRLFDRFFPERQIYHRRHGHVDFFHVSPLFQIFTVLLTAGVLTWVAYASVNVVFKNEIIRSKDRRIVRLEQTYENRLADMQAAYDELLGVLSLTQERFAESTGALSSRQRQIEALLDYQLDISRDIEGVRRKYAVMAGNSDGDKTNAILMRLQPTEVAKRVSRVPTVTMRRPVQSVSQVLGAVAGSRKPHEAASLSAKTARSLEAEELRVHADQGSMAQHVELSLRAQVHHFEGIIRHTGLSTEEVLSRFVLGEGEAVGGPYIRLTDQGLWEPDASASDEFGRQLLRIATTLDKLSSLHMAISTMPLNQPVDTFRLTSGFGIRRDPFTRRAAFHSGLDFAALRRTKVMSTAPGKVVHAGWKGAYGKLIEIDHGFGFKTRYGHLHKILVKKGDIVDLREPIGTVGNTGRSTGPHLHYEVWFDGEVRNPIKYLKAGRYVFER